MFAVLMVVACTKGPTEPEVVYIVVQDSGDPVDSAESTDTGTEVDDSGDSGTDSGVDSGTTVDSGESTGLDTGYDQEDVVEPASCEGDFSYTLAFYAVAYPGDEVLIVGHYTDGYKAYREAGGSAVASDWEQVTAEFDEKGRPMVLCNWWDEPEYEFYVMDQFVLTITRAEGK